MALHRPHIGCPFRLDGPNGPVVGSGDMSVIADDPAATPDDYDWLSPGQSLYDFKVRQFIDKNAGRVFCQGVESDKGGGFTLELSAGHWLIVSPVSTWNQEWWRYFRAGEDSDHFVVLPSPMSD